MINRIFYKGALVVVVLFLSLFISAQESTIVKATIDKSNILIGEQISLVLEADVPENEPIRFFAIDSLPHFEILNASKIDTSNTSTGTRLVQTIRITSFDSGHFVIPSFVIGDKLVTDSLPVDVGYSSFDPQQAYHDIKDIIEVEPPKEKKKQWWLWIASGVLLFISILLLVFRKKKKPVIVAAPIPVNPYNEAMTALAVLKMENDPKQYYSKLVDIFRVYIFAKKNIHSQKQTSDDLIVQLRDIHMGAEPFDKLAKALRLSDFVKFAKYIPGENDTATAFNGIKNAIDSIEQLP